MGEALRGLPPEWPIVPVKTGTKGEMLIKKWSTKSLPELQKAVARHYPCNLGLRLDFFIALDPDSIAAVIFLGKLELEGKLPPSVSWRSASGRITRLYRIPPGVKVKSITHQSNDLFLELRTGPGHQCLIPPSQAKNKQGEMKQYTWINEPWSNPVALLPCETLEIIQGLARPTKKRKSARHKPRPASPVTPEHDLSGNIAEGGRNNYLFSRGRGLRGKGADREEIEAALQELNQEKCRLPLPPGEASRIAASAAGYPANAKADLWTLKLTYADVLSALGELGRGKWIKRAALIEKLREMAGPRTIVNSPASLATVKRVLRRMLSKRLISHRAGGWYKIPNKREIPVHSGAD